MIRWLKDASQTERQTFWACFAGWCLDAFDSQMLGLALPFLIVSLSLSRAEAGWIPSLTLATAALGGWLGGALSDRFGRVRVLQGAVLWFALFSLACASAPTYFFLIIFKAAQGLGFGAEWAAGAVLIAETIRPANRGKAMGAVQSGWAVGWGAAVLISVVVFSSFASAVSWRVLFAIGLLPALLVLWIQRHLVTVPHKRRQTAPSFGTSLVGIFRRDSLRATAAGGLLGIGAHGGYYGLFTWLPTYLKSDRGLSVISTGAYLGVIIFSFGIGCLFAGQFLDWLGRSKAITLFAVGCILTIACDLLLSISNAEMLFLGFPLGFFAAGIPASMGTLFSEMFAQNIRGSGVGFCYNFGRVVAAGFPALVGILSDHLSLGLATGAATIAAYSLVLIAIAILPRGMARPMTADGTLRSA